MNRKQTKEHINTYIRKLMAENKINYSVVPELVLFIEEAFESWEKSMTEELIVKVSKWEESMGEEDNSLYSLGIRHSIDTIRGTESGEHRPLDKDHR